jgi:hypothetical protein
MNLDCIRSAAITALMLFGVSIASAQGVANLGELLDKGAKRLDAAEMKALIPGATTKGATIGGRLDMETTFAAEGTAAGRFWGGHAEMPPLYNGTWNINDQGQLCIDFMAAERSIGRMKGCGWWYSLNGVYYIAGGSEDRGAVVRSRKVTR